LYGGSILGALNGLYAGAGIIGALTVFWFLDVLGWKKSIQVISICYVISAAIQAGSVYIAMFLVGRFFNGLAVGWINCTVPLYMSEISPAHQRGHLVSTHGFIICSAYVSIKAICCWKRETD
jgi:MFS family permease